MAIVHPTNIAHSPLYTSPHPQFETAHPIIRPLRASHAHTDSQSQSHTHTAKYTTALETEHSRDLYLQGAMAVGQIARLLEELCADIYYGDDDGETDDDEEEEDEDDAEETMAMVEVSTHHIHQFVTDEKRDQIAAWTRAVTPANDISCGQVQQPPCDADIIDLEDADATYLRGAFVVGDIADLLGELVKGLDDEKDEPREEDCSLFSPEQVALAQLPAGPSLMAPEILDTDFASRLSCLSARLARLELDIRIFSQDRSDALKQMEIDDGSVVAAAQDPDEDFQVEHWSPGCGEVAERVYGEFPADALGICDTLESEDRLLITRVWTTTDTTTSGISLATPSESEVQPVNYGYVKDYFWDLD